MLKNTIANLKVIRKVALALGPLNKRVVYVGGATVSLYVNDPAAEDVRPTKDLDISLDIATLGELEAVREQLAKKGFSQTAEDNVICRFRYEDIKVDVMSTKAIGWAPANPWFEPGFVHRETVMVEDQQVQILPLSYFLASKFNAFCGRGARDPRTSHDFEDIIYIMDNRIDFIEQLRYTPSDVKSYLLQQMQNILHNRAMQEAIYGNLFHVTREARYQRIIAAVKQISSWG